MYKKFIVRPAFAASCVLMPFLAAADTIDVPTFGPMFNSASGYYTVYGGQSFGPGWNVTAGYNAYGNVNVVGNGWQSPDGNATVEMDGVSPPGQISTQIIVPHDGTVTVDFYLAGDPAPNAGHVDTQPKQLEVQLGSDVGVGPSVINTFDSSSTTLLNMGWVMVSDTFLASAGTNYLTFSSLDFPGYDFSNGSDSGPALGTVTAFEGDTPPPLGTPDNGSSLLLLAVSAGGMACLRRRTAVSAF